MTGKLFLYIILILAINANLTPLYAQKPLSSGALGSQQPYFGRLHTVITDTLFSKDLQVLKQLCSFDEITTTLLKKPVLRQIMFDQIEKGKPGTYQTIVDYIQDFKTTEAYQDFADGIRLYQKLEVQKVNLANWEADKLFFVRLGFTAADLEDLKAFISQPEHREMTYKQVYMSYLEEMEALPTGRPK